MRRFAFQGDLIRPIGKYAEILTEVMRPDPGVKPIDLCCGLGFGKTVLAIQAAVLTLNIDGNQVGLFQEPDWDRVNYIFLPKWQKFVHPDLYTIQYGTNLIRWWNGSYLTYKPRVITGSRERARSKFRGIDFSFVIDDEAAIGFDFEQYQNTFARIRIDSPVRYYFTLSTPLVGPYGNFLKRGGNKIYRGRTRDNKYLLHRDPTYETRQRELMGTEQARRELDGELLALEGRIWKTAKYVADPGDPDYKESAWPNGNRDDEWTCFRPGEPWWLFCDFGSATGAFVVVQRREPYYRGRRLFQGAVWVAVADLCPRSDANASSAFQRLKAEFGSPIAVTGGADINTRSSSEGKTVSYFASNIFGNSPGIYTGHEDNASKRIQYDVLNYLICASNGERRFTVARDFVSLDLDSKRGVREMLIEDAWPADDKIRMTDFLPKNRENTVQHCRDALLIGAEKVMCPARWGLTKNPAAA